MNQLFTTFARVYTTMTKRNKLYNVLTVLVVLILYAPMAQKQFKCVKIRPLKGVEQKEKMPSLSWESYSKGIFQGEIEAYLKQNFGFRAPLIRLYNQYLWDFFGYTNVSAGQVSFGKNGWLYEPWFVEDYYQSRMYHYTDDSLVMAQKLNEEAFRIFQLQNILKSYGIDLFVCMLPGKDFVYPENLPENTAYHKKKYFTAKEFYGKRFPELGINHINIGEWFLQMKDTADFPLFPQTGTHWSNLSALYAADSILHYMEGLKGIQLAKLNIGQKQEGEAISPDDDLESLMNLIRPLYNTPHFNAKATVNDSIPGTVKAKLITIGDSFFWNIANQLPMSGIFSSFPYWYYNSTVYFDNLHNSVNDIDIVEELLSADFVMLSYCSVQQYEMSNGFTQRALMELCYDEDSIKSKKDIIRINIQNDSKQMESIQSKASKEGLSVDEQLEKEVKETLVKNLYKYFPALNDSTPVIRSKRITAYFSQDSISFVQNEIEKTILKIRNNPSSLEMVKKKAIERNMTLEDMIKADAVWIVDKKIKDGDLIFRSNKSIKE
jgi:hypothetical protein